MIDSEDEMDADERAAVIVIHLALNDLVFSHPKILSRKMNVWEDPGVDVLTPWLVRGIVQEHAAGLGRAELVEKYILARLKINGADFLVWEKDPRAVVRTTGEIIERG